MNWNEILKLSVKDWSKRQKKTGKTINRETERWKEMQEQGEVDPDPSLPHKFTGRRRDVTGDPEGSGHRDIAAGRSKGTRERQRAKPPTAIRGGGSRSKGKRGKEEWIETLAAKKPDEIDPTEEEDREIRRENALTDKQYTAFTILEEYMEVPNGTADQVDEFVIREVKGMSPEVIDALIALYEQSSGRR